MRSLVEPERPERVPGLVVESEQDLRALGTHQVRFAQTHQDIPVFGASAVVELTGDARPGQRERRSSTRSPGSIPSSPSAAPRRWQRVADYTGWTSPPRPA